MREAIDQALRLLQLGSELDVPAAVEVLKKAREQEPVAWMDNDGNVSDWQCPGYSIPLYTAPPPSIVAWGVDWGTNGGQSCVSILKKHANGTTEVVAVEYSPRSEDKNK